MTSRAGAGLSHEVMDAATDMTNRPGHRPGRPCSRDERIDSNQTSGGSDNEPNSIVLSDTQASCDISAMPASSVVAALLRQMPELKSSVQSISDDHQAIALLEGYVAALLNLETPLSSKLASIASDHLVELIRNALGVVDRQARAKPGQGIRTARRQTVMQEITANLTRHDLSSDGIARRLGITPRYLRKLLQDEGVSFSDLVRQMRTQKAYQILSDPRQLSLTISQIAYQVGFSDLSYFNQCFRRQFGVTPTDIRTLAIRKVAPEVTSTRDDQ